jgi:nitrogen fixation protein NifQ
MSCNIKIETEMYELGFELQILEQKVKSFLESYGKDQYAKETIASLVAKTSLMGNHLYEDLGFRSRVEMGRFMQEHFPSLFEIKPKEKLWKKFIYDSIDEIAPACKDCKDQINCFSCKV